MAQTADLLVLFHSDHQLESELPQRFALLLFRDTVALSAETFEERAGEREQSTA